MNRSVLASTFDAEINLNRSSHQQLEELWHFNSKMLILRSGNDINSKTPSC